VVVDGETGLLVPLKTPTVLAKAIRTLTDDPALARRMGEAGRARVDREFAVGPMIDRFATLFETLARQAGRLPARGEGFEAVRE
jgi:glycosyltransferase involved in cell wall biosynthesis